MKKHEEIGGKYEETCSPVHVPWDLEKLQTLAEGLGKILGHSGFLHSRNGDPVPPIEQTGKV